MIYIKHVTVDGNVMGEPWTPERKTIEDGQTKMFKETRKLIEGLKVVDRVTLDIIIKSLLAKVDITLSFKMCLNYQIEREVVRC